MIHCEGELSLDSSSFPCAFLCPNSSTEQLSSENGENPLFGYCLQNVRHHATGKIILGSGMKEAVARPPDRDGRAVALLQPFALHCIAA